MQFEIDFHLKCWESFDLSTPEHSWSILFWREIHSSNKNSSSNSRGRNWKLTFNMFGVGLWFCVCSGVDSLINTGFYPIYRGIRSISVKWRQGRMNIIIYYPAPSNRWPHTMGTGCAVLLCVCHMPSVKRRYHITRFHSFTPYISSS